MLFVRRPTVIVEDEATHAEQTRLAEERGMNSGAVAVLGIVGLVAVLLLVGYFAWWAPMNNAQAQNPPVIHDTHVIEQIPSSPPTIINNPPANNPPTIIHDQASPPTVIHHDHYIPVPVPTTGNTNGGNATDAGATGGDIGTTSGATGTTGTTTGQ